MRTLTILTLSLLLLSPSSRACRIFLQELGEIPAVHSETTLVLEYGRTHRNCSLSLSAIKVTAEGMTILSSTSWKETGAQSFQRKFKVRIDSADCALKIRRPCPKGGLDEKLIIKIRPSD
jgi:hypothetical protein